MGGYHGQSTKHDTLMRLKQRLDGFVSLQSTLEVALDEASTSVLRESLSNVFEADIQDVLKPRCSVQCCRGRNHSQ